ncbi:hypothetical protein Egran_00144 [Elaphomyces granulatus]|uniref:Uncharacterized protein n=1 Tax=Elaphomyces granulatus TaxID=519963 RepID=A0A232M6R0_9EURO|nr:hypothetical protein Egran_00144 [Elaphomyces granulatus]
MPRSRSSSLIRNQSRSRSRSDSHSPDPANQARGYKATLSNPRVSQEAKEHAKRVLDEEFEGVAVSSDDEEGFKNPTNVARGLKA